MSEVVVPFVFALRSRGVKVGTTELLQLARALSANLHDASLDGFYYVARSLLVHREEDLDAFDRAFSEHFRGVADASLALAEGLLAWLDDPIQRRELSPDDLAALVALSPEELRRLFEERLREQKERHDGGNHFIGTGGTSPFGNAGTHPTGVRVGGRSGGRSALGVADARAFAPYRSDVVLDVRQIEVALRKLRAWLREGAPDELDLEATIEATAKSGGELDLKLRPRRRPDARVLLLMDVGGSMDPYAHLVSKLFSAAKRASHFRELKSYYFHNCIYGYVYETEQFREPMRVVNLIDRLDARWRVIFVGDASMHPAELLGASPWGATEADRGAGEKTGIGWIQRIAEHFPRSVWLNPDPPRYWESGTADIIRQVVPMHHLSLEGLGEAVRVLSKKRV